MIDAMAELEEPFSALRIDVIGNRRTAGCDRLRQHCGDGIVKPTSALASNARSNCQRMNAGSEQGLIGVNVTQPSKEILIEQQCLDPRLAALERSLKFRKRYFKWLGPEFFYTLRKLRTVLQTPELAAVVVEQHTTAVQRQDGVSVLAGGAAQQQTAGHTQVNDQVTTALK